VPDDGEERMSKNRRTQYVVTVGDEIGRFTSYFHAMDFACANSYGGRLTQVEGVKERGLVGQYRNGKPTPEFALHDAEYRKAFADKLSAEGRI
jgi:hypothetical protein